MRTDEFLDVPHNDLVVVQVVSFYPPRLGGMERVAQSVAELLAGSHRVEVITTDRGAKGAPARERHAGVRVRRYRALEIAHTPLSPGVVVGLLTLPRGALVHAHVAQAFLPEAVWLTCALRRRKFVVHFHLDVDASGRFGTLLPAYKRFVLGPVLRRADAVVALSPPQATFLADRYRVPHERIWVIPNGVGSVPNQGPSRMTLDRAPGQPVRLLFVGRLDAQKNVPRLLDAMGRIGAPAELALVGDGEQRRALEEHIRRAGLRNVRLVGPRTGAELASWYSWADVFVLPSDKEGMPVVLLEAMAFGLAIVATDVPGTREAVDGVALLAKPNAAALGAALRQVVTDPALRAHLAARSSARAPAHSWSGPLADIERMYDQVVRAR